MERYKQSFRLWGFGGFNMASSYKVRKYSSTGDPKIEALLQILRTKFYVGIAATLMWLKYLLPTAS